MKELLTDFGQDVEAVLLSDGWHGVAVWTDKDGNVDPDGASSLEVNDDLVGFTDQGVDRRITCPVSSVIAIRWNHA